MKTTKAQVAAPFGTQDIELKIEGLMELHGDPGVFRLSDVPIMEPPDYGAIEQMLIDKGIDRMWATMLVEEFARNVSATQLAMVLAQRTTRIG